MNSPHKEGLCIRFGWVIIMVHEVNQSGFCLTSNTIDASLGGLTLHDTTYNTPMTWGEFVDVVCKEYAGRTLTLTNGLVLNGQYLVNEFRRVLNRAVPYIYTIPSNEFVTRFDIFVTSRGEIYAS